MSVPAKVTTSSLLLLTPNLLQSKPITSLTFEASELSSLSIKSKSNSPSRTSSFSPSRNIVIPTSSIDICSNNECDVGFDELDLSNNNNESILELISNNGNNVGTLIIPNILFLKIQLFQFHLSQDQIH